MKIRLAPAMVILTVLILTSCNKPAAPQATVVEVPVVETQVTPINPSCAIESDREFKLEDGIELRIWNLKANGLKRLTARLLVAQNGQVQTANEVEYTWDRWEPDAKAATGQLVLMIQDGKKFGVKGKRIPMLAVDLKDSPSYSRIGKNSGLVLEGDLQSRMMNSSYSTPLGPRSILYSQLFSPTGETGQSYSLSSSLESLATNSKNGRMIVAVEFEWVPQ